MHATLLNIHPLTTGTAHHAFTSLAEWRKRTYCAYRVAATHHITPPGDLVIDSLNISGDATPPRHLITTRVTLPAADLRDPRLIPAADALHLLCGAYHPSPVHQDWHGLSKTAADNLLQTYYSYTIDGETWAPLTPILRPNYWGWSAVYVKKYWVVAAYHIGSKDDMGMSLALFAGPHLYDLRYHDAIYDGLQLLPSRDGTRTPHYLPCEPVLWQPAPDTLACCVRTETGMDLGVSRFPWQDWRWADTGMLLHPSAVIETRHGWLLAAREIQTTNVAREIQKVVAARPRRDLPKLPPPPPVWRTTLYELPPGHATPRKLLTLPSAGDCAYAGLALGEDQDTVLCSWYSQHRQDDITKANPLPGAQVYLATVRLGA